MIIKEYVWYDEDTMNSSIQIYFDDKIMLDVWETDASEDNNLGRNFQDCYNILWMLKKVYELGKNWVDITFKEEGDL